MVLKLTQKLLETKNIRNTRYLYWNSLRGKISIGKLDEIISLARVRMRKRSRDKQALLDILEILGRTNLHNFFYEYSPSELVDAFEEI